MSSEGQRDLLDLRVSAKGIGKAVQTGLFQLFDREIMARMQFKHKDRRPDMAWKVHVMTVATKHELYEAVMD